VPVDRSRVASLVADLLLAIGEDPARPGLVRTPERVADACAEFFAGIDQDPAEPLRHPISVSRGPAPDTAATGPVLLRGIRFRSICEHHLLPFRGRAHLAYLPGDEVVGLGALPAVVDILAARPQVQERLGEQIADTLAEALDQVFGGDAGVEDVTPGEDVEEVPDAPVDGEAPEGGEEPTGEPTSTPTATQAPTAQPTAPAGDARAALRSALEDARDAIEAGQAALAESDFAAYGEAQAALQEALERALAAEAELEG
jgi:GTP cyclohydrolase I